MQVKRKFNDLSDLDKGVSMVLKKLYSIVNTTDVATKYSLGYIDGLETAIDYCEECLDVATLGDIEFE